jgi:ABC-2 type transport system permease protein
VAQLDDRAASAPIPSQPAPYQPAQYQPAPAIPAATQLLAIAWMRWRMFANGFRRQAASGKSAGFVLSILLRMILWPILALWVIGPAIGAAFFAWRAIAHHHPERLIPLLAGVAILWQFIAVNGTSMAATLSTFEPASLLRFPLRFGRYLLLRLLLGLLTPSTIVGCLVLFAAALGIGIADSSLAPAAFFVLAIYAALNIFFSRMIAVWLERWLATRRAREIFGALMAFVFIGFQYFNFNRLKFRRPTGHPAHPPTDSWLLNFLNGNYHFLNWLPPGFATNSIVPGHALVRLAQFAALLAWTALFLAAFAFRLHRQFLGEYISEGAPRTTAAASTPRAFPRAPAPTPAGVFNQQLTTNNQQLFSPTIAACLRKEWLYLRGNSNQIVAMLTPLVFVFLFAKGMLARHPSYLLTGAIGYSLLGLMAALYNIFGADGAGVQLYLLAPVRLRDVILSKNIASLALLGAEAVLAWCVVAAVATVPIPLSMQISTFLWVIFMLFANLTLGTLRSIQAPRKISIAQARRMRSPATGKTSGLLVLAILFGSILLQVPVTLICRHFHNPWLAVVIFMPLAAVAVAAYALLLSNADRLILTHRDTFAQELCSD